MRFSDAVVLGSSLRKFGGGALYEDGLACALGMAGLGSGVITEPIEACNDDAYTAQYTTIRRAFTLSYDEEAQIIQAWDGDVMGHLDFPKSKTFEQFVEWSKKFDREPLVQEPTQVETRQESTVSHD